MSKKNVMMNILKGNCKKDEFISFMEMADDEIVLFHRTKSFKQALSLERAFELLKEDSTILRTVEVDIKLRNYLEKISA